MCHEINFDLMFFTSDAEAFALSSVVEDVIKVTENENWSFSPHHMLRSVSARGAAAAASPGGDAAHQDALSGEEEVHHLSFFFNDVRLGKICRNEKPKG